MTPEQFEILAQHVPNNYGPLDDMSCNCGWMPKGDYHKEQYEWCLHLKEMMEQ